MDTNAVTKIRCRSCRKKFSGPADRLAALTACPACGETGRWQTDAAHAASVVDQSRLTEPSFPAPHRAILPGTIVAQRYRIERLIGVGGHGEVYSAHDPISKATVALKRLRSDSSSAEMRRRFVRESESLKALSHPNIVRYLDFVEGDAGPFLVTEFINGITLAAKIKSAVDPPKPLATTQIECVMQAVCSALKFAHQAGRIHRDIKPSNIMLSDWAVTCESALRLDRDEEVPIKLLDFGLAQASDGLDLSVTGFGLGTLDYCSPEQKSNAKHIDQRTDVYSVGAVLYEMLTGLAPPPHPSRLQVGWQPLVLKACEPLAKDRYGSIDEFYAAFEKTRLAELKPVSSKKAPAAKVESAETSITLRQHLLQKNSQEPTTGGGRTACTQLSAEDVKNLTSSWESALKSNIGFKKWYAANLHGCRDHISRLAASGNADAQYLLALCYLHATGGDGNDLEVREWLQCAAKQEHVAAQTALGHIFYVGSHGAREDHAKAASLFKSASRKANPTAQFWLAKCFELGKGLPQDIVAARRWYQEAAANGDEQAQKMLAEIEPHAIGDAKRRLPNRVAVFVAGMVGYCSLFAATIALAFKSAPVLTILMFLGMGSGLAGFLLARAPAKSAGGVFQTKQDKLFSTGFLLSTSCAAVCSVAAAILLLSVVNSSFGGGVMIAVLVFAFVVMLIYLIAAQSSACPACHKFFAEETINKVELGRFLKNETRTQRTDHYRDDPNALFGKRHSGHSDTYYDVQVLYRSVRRTHRCKFCRHQWQTDAEERLG